jgi:hypothetical protein
MASGLISSDSSQPPNQEDLHLYSTDSNRSVKPTRPQSDRHRRSSKQSTNQLSNAFPEEHQKTAELKRQELRRYLE